MVTERALLRNGTTWMPTWRELRFYNILVCSVRAAERQASSGAPRDWSVLGVEGGALAGGVLRARGRSTPR